MPVSAFSWIKSEHHVILSDSHSYFQSQLLIVVHMIWLRGRIQDKLCSHGCAFLFCVCVTEHDPRCVFHTHYTAFVTSAEQIYHITLEYSQNMSLY